MVILGGNAKPKPEQVSKLVKEARGLQSPPVTKLKMDLFWGIFLFFKNFQFLKSFKIVLNSGSLGPRVGLICSIIVADKTLG